MFSRNPALSDCFHRGELNPDMRNLTTLYYPEDPSERGLIEVNSLFQATRDVRTREKELTMNDDRSKVEQHARNLVRVFLILFPSQETIEKGLRLWKSSRLHGLWPDRPCIGSVSSSNLRPEIILTSS
jgi:hypothetical protein